MAWTGRSLLRIITTNAPDFSILWLAAKDLIGNKNPYLNPEIFTGVGYPPPTLILYLPLTLFPYPIAQTIFVLSSFTAVFCSVLLSLRLSLGKISWQNFLLATSLAFLAFPMKFTLGMGQNNSLALLLLLLSYSLNQQKRVLVGGILLGLAISLKPILVFLLLFFLIKRAWYLLFYVLLSVGILTILALFLSNLNIFSYYFSQVVPPLFNLLDKEIYYNQGAMGFISRITSNLFLRQYLNLAVSSVLVLVSVWFIFKKRAVDLSFSLLIITLLLIDTLSWQHHFVWLIFPFILLTNYAFKAKSFLLLGLIGLSYLLVSWNFKNPALFSNFPWSFFLSHAFYGGVILLVVNVYFLKKSKTRG